MQTDQPPTGVLQFLRAVLEVLIPMAVIAGSFIGLGRYLSKLERKPKPISDTEDMGKFASLVSAVTTPILALQAEVRETNRKNDDHMAQARQTAAAVHDLQQKANALEEKVEIVVTEQANQGRRLRMIRRKQREIQEKLDAGK